MNNFDKIFLNCLGSGDRVKQQIENNQNLVEDAKSRNPFIFSSVKVIIPFLNVDEIMKHFTYEKIFSLLKKERPDLYKNLNNPKGRKWLYDQIENFKNYFIKI